MLLEPTFIASAVVITMRMRRQDHVAHGTSPLYTSVRSLHDVHSVGPSALGCVNSVEICTSIYNLYIRTLGLFPVVNTAFQCLSVRDTNPIGCLYRLAVCVTIPLPFHSDASQVRTNLWSGS